MIRCLTLLAVVAVAQGTFAAEPKVAERWAVLIGVDDYIQAEDLKFCGADQRALHSRLISAGFPKENILLLEDKAIDQKYLPFKSNIEKQLDLVLGVVEKNDLVVIAFSGHGVHLGGKSFFCPKDADLDKPETLIALDNVYQRFDESEASLKVLLVDACRNDPRLTNRRSSRSTSPREEARQFTRSLESIPEGVVLLNSCTAGEVSYEDVDIGHGVFMNFVLEGLDGAADGDRNGRVSLDELSRYANTKTKSYVVRKFNDQQRPFLKGNLSVDVLDFELAKSIALPPGLNVPAADTSTKNTVGQAIKNSIDMPLVLIPAGEFDMGSTEGPTELRRRFPKALPDWMVGEQPVHKVRISKAFYLGKYEVTLGEFLTFYHDAKYRSTAELNGKGGTGYSEEEGPLDTPRRDFVPWSWGFRGQTNRHPVVNVSWHDAKAFCDWLSNKEQCVYRLPTAAEWEYACRAGSSGRYHFGDEPEGIVDFDNVYDGSNSEALYLRLMKKIPAGARMRPFPDYKKLHETQIDAVSAYDGFAVTAPVGSFRPNSFGIHDVHGNVVEWCADWYALDYYKESPNTDPSGPAEGTGREIRGGYWSGFPVMGRSAYRTFGDPSLVMSSLGFRVVRERE